MMQKVCCRYPVFCSQNIQDAGRGIIEMSTCPLARCESSTVSCSMHRVCKMEVAVTSFQRRLIWTFWILPHSSFRFRYVRACGACATGLSVRLVSPWWRSQFLPLHLSSAGSPVVGKLIVVSACLVYAQKPFFSQRSSAV